MKKKIFFIVGPTAIGKTEIACALAQKIDAEIISCDAMQVYKEISLLNAKPDPAILKKVKHHLISAISVTEDFDVFTFRKKVLRAIGAIEKKKKVPLIVGGSGLYMAILLDGIFEEEHRGRNLRTRKKIEQEIKKNGLMASYERLKKADPRSAEKIHPHDMRRIVRALEVFDVYGKPISALHPKRKGLWNSHDVMIFALTMERPSLYARINDRVEQMFAHDVVGEVKKAGRKKISQTASGIIGLKEIQMLLKGKLDQETAKDLIKRNSRHYAKRQLTWFRKDKRLKWVQIEEKGDLSLAVKNILKQIGASHV